MNGAHPAPETWLRDHRAAGHRALVVLEGSRALAREYAEALLAYSGCRTTLRLTDLADNPGPALNDPKPAQLVGMEIDGLVLDAWAGFDADVIGAAAGTVRGGGVVILCCPLLEEWPDHHLLTAAAGVDTSAASEAGASRFLLRLAGILRNDPRVLVLRCGALTLPRGDLEPPSEAPGDPKLTREQQHAVAAIRHVVTGQRRRPVVLTADRGRGKSAALGHAAAMLVREGARRIVITAIRRGAVDVVFRFARAALGEAASAVRARSRIEAGASTIEFVDPWQLLAAPGRPDLVLVDEAAALPLDWHERALRRFSRIAFATTVHGYEGSGRGFAMRFASLLAVSTRGWREVRLTMPVRWAAGDPLEGLLFDALLLNAEPADIGVAPSPDERECRIQRLDRDALAGDESLLRQVFGLLVQSHYRTRPNDLVHLLDAPNLEVVVARRDDLVVGAVVLAREGAFDESVAERVWRGRARPRGHMLAEALCAQLGARDALHLRGVRIVRIAVHAGLRRRGIGSQLLKWAVASARHRGFDYAGVSFAVGGEVARFFIPVGFSPLWLSGRRNATSGVRSLVMALPMTEAAAGMLEAARRRFLEGFAIRLAGVYADEDAGNVELMFSNGPPGDVLERQDIEEVTRFARGEATFESCFTGIWNAAPLVLSQAGTAARCTSRERALLIALVLQQRHPGDTGMRGYGPLGRTAMLDALRTMFARLLSHLGEGPSGSVGGRF